MGCLVLLNGGNKYLLGDFLFIRCAELLSIDFGEAWPTGRKSLLEVTAEKRRIGRGKSTSKSRILSIFLVSESKLTTCCSAIARNHSTRVARPSWLSKFG